MNEMMTQLDNESSQAGLNYPTESSFSEGIDDEQRKKIDVNQAIQELLNFSSRKTSGAFQFSIDEISWKVFIDQGTLQYTSMSIQGLTELNYHLQALNCKQAMEAIKAVKGTEQRGQQLAAMPLHRIISWLHKQGFISREQGSDLFQRISREALEPLFWLNQNHNNWQEENPEPLSVELAPSLSMPILVEELSERLQTWQNLLDVIESPYHRPYLFNAPSNEKLSNSVLLKLSKLMRGFSIHQMANIIKQDEIKLAQMLYSYIKSGKIFLREPEVPWNKLPKPPRLSQLLNSSSLNSKVEASQKIFKIACVDDSPTILREMKRLLGGENYEITVINNPVEAASILFRLRPNLVFMDISMPEINGYKLCSLLRNSNALFEIPIIMVTSRTGIIDKVRAKASGATDYLTKPFTKETLLELVQKHLN